MVRLLDQFIDIFPLMLNKTHYVAKLSGKLLKVLLLQIRSGQQAEFIIVYQVLPAFFFYYVGKL